MQTQTKKHAGCMEAFPLSFLIVAFSPLCVSGGRCSDSDQQRERARVAVQRDNAQDEEEPSPRPLHCAALPHHGGALPPAPDEGLHPKAAGIRCPFPLRMGNKRTPCGADLQQHWLAPACQIKPNRRTIVEQIRFCDGIYVRKSKQKDHPYDIVFVDSRKFRSLYVSAHQSLSVPVLCVCLCRCLCSCLANPGFAQEAGKPKPLLAQRSHPLPTLGRHGGLLQRPRRVRALGGDGDA